MTMVPLTAGRPATTDAPAPSVMVTAAKLELIGSLNFSTTAGGGAVTVEPAAGVIDVSAAWADAARAVAREENTASSMDSTATQREPGTLTSCADGSHPPGGMSASRARA